MNSSNTRPVVTHLLLAVAIHPLTEAHAPLFQDSHHSLVGLGLSHKIVLGILGVITMRRCVQRGLARGRNAGFDYPANALSVIYIHSESIHNSNIQAQLNQALPNIRPQKA